MSDPRKSGSTKKAGRSVRTLSRSEKPSRQGSGSALFSCFTASDIEAVMADGIDINEVDREHGETALHRACQRGLPDVVKALLRHGARVDVKDGAGQQPLHALLRKESYANPGVQKIILTLLLKNDADPNAVDRRGETPLHYAARKGNATFCNLLVLAGGDLGFRRRATTKTPGEVFLSKLPGLVKESPWRERFAALSLNSTLTSSSLPPKMPQRI